MKRSVMFALATALLAIGAAGSLAEEVVPHPVLVVTEWSQDWEDLTVVISNPGPRTERGFLVFWYMFHGQVGGMGLELELAEDSEMALNFNLNGETTLGVGMYSDRPDSITDAPEPVARVLKGRELPPRDDGDGDGD